MSSVYMKQGSAFIPTNDANLDVRQELPIGTYVVSHSMTRGFYFESAPNFTLPSKIYGDLTPRAERVKTTFRDRKNSTGVILAGEKGSGKTLLAKKLSIDLMEEGVVTIIVNQAFSGDSFNSIIQGLEQPAYVLFDEYEKVYADPEAQAALLTLFDGLFSSKKLFAVTSNDKYKVSEYMRNRPGRFFYSFSYAGLDNAFIREYLEDNLNDKKQIEPFLRYASTFEAFNFDMLQALVEEMNRYSESIVESAKYVNVEQSWSARKTYELVAAELKPGADVKNFLGFISGVVNGGSSFNPYASAFYVYYKYTYVDESAKKGDQRSWEEQDHIMVSPTDIKSFTEDGQITYENDEVRVTIRKKEAEKFDVSNYL